MQALHVRRGITTIEGMRMAQLDTNLSTTNLSSLETLSIDGLTFRQAIIEVQNQLVKRKGKLTPSYQCVSDEDKQLYRKLSNGLRKILNRVEFDLAERDWDNDVHETAVPVKVVVSEAIDKAKSRLVKQKRESVQPSEPSPGEITARTDKSESTQVGSSTSQMCKKVLRRIFLKYTRQNSQVLMTEPVFLAFALDAKIDRLLLSENELKAAFAAASSLAPTMDVGKFLKAVEICALAFQRPPHNVKLELDGSTLKMQLQLWRFLGLHDGSWESRFEHYGESDDFKPRDAKN